NRPGTPCSTTYLDTTRRSSPNPDASSRPSTRKTHRNNPTPRPGHHPRPHDDPPLLQGTQPINSTPAAHRCIQAKSYLDVLAIPPAWRRSFLIDERVRAVVDEPPTTGCPRAEHPAGA